MNTTFSVSGSSFFSQFKSSATLGCEQNPSEKAKSHGSLVSRQIYRFLNLGATDKPLLKRDTLLSERKAYAPDTSL